MEKAPPLEPLEAVLSVKVLLVTVRLEEEVLFEMPAPNTLLLLIDPNVGSR